MKTLLLLGFSLFSASVLAEGFSDFPSSEKSLWNSANHPKIILKDHFVSKLSSLPTEGEVEKIPWSDSYWPRFLGGVAQRWQSGQSAYGYKIIKKKSVSKLSEEQIESLSPAEKFDLLNGDYRFPFTKKVKRDNGPEMSSWQGICHGWSQAAIHYPAAKPMTLKNKFGLSIPFGASDVQALLSYFYAREKTDGVRILGQRCNGSDMSSLSCADTNAGAFHLVMANSIGLEKKSFAIDADPGLQVWNQPVHSYNYSLSDERAPSYGAAPGTVREVRVETNFTFVLEADSSWDSQPRPVTGTHSYKYWLELDGNDSIIGGSWVSSLRPDFIWVENKGQLTNKFSVLKQFFE